MSRLCPSDLSLVLEFVRTSILTTPGDVIHIDFPCPGAPDERNLCSGVLAASMLAGRSAGYVSSREQTAALNTQWEGQWLPHQASPLVLRLLFLFLGFAPGWRALS